MHDDSHFGNDSRTQIKRPPPIGYQTPRFKQLVRYLTDPQLVTKEVELIMQITTKFQQSERARRPRKPRSNPKLDEYVLKCLLKNLGSSAREILATLDRMTERERREVMGKAKWTGNKTIKNAMRRVLLKRLKQLEAASRNRTSSSPAHRQEVKPRPPVNDFTCYICECRHPLKRRRVRDGQNYC